MKKNKILNRILLLTIFFIVSPLSAYDFLDENTKIVKGRGYSSFIIGRSFHRILGRDIFNGRFQYIKYPYIYIARRYGITRINLNTKKTKYLQLPDEFNGGDITSIYANNNDIWTGTSNGIVYRYDSDKKIWKSYKISENGSIWLGRLNNELVAVLSDKGGSIYIYVRILLDRKGDKVKIDRFRKTFSIPFNYPIIPNMIIKKGKWNYLATDTGIIRYSNMGRFIWEMLGTRDHLSKVNVNNLCSNDGYLLVAASKQQYAKLPVNIKLTSYGFFYYNYFQKRWERKTDFLTEEIKKFLKINRVNIYIPGGGLWLYDISSDRAVKIFNGDINFFKIVPFDKLKGIYIASSEKGIYLIRVKNKMIELSKMDFFNKIWINDLNVDKNKIFILVNNKLTVMSKNDFLSKFKWRNIKSLKSKKYKKPYTYFKKYNYKKEIKFMKDIEAYLFKSRGK